MDFASLLTNPIVILIGLISGVCSIIALPLGVVLYFKSKKEKRPRFLVRSNTLVRNLQTTLPGLRITYEGHREPLANVTVSRIAFWNDGRETIQKADVIKERHVVITSADNQVIFLDVEVLGINKKINKIVPALATDKGRVKIQFEFLDHKDGCVLQVIHTGQSVQAIKVDGYIKGCGSPKSVENSSASVAVAWLLGLITAVCLELSYKWLNPSDRIRSIGVPILLLLGFMLAIANRKFGTPEQRIPKALRRYMVTNNESKRPVEARIEPPVEARLEPPVEAGPAHSG
jgi:hypothetical protein